MYVYSSICILLCMLTVRNAGNYFDTLFQYNFVGRLLGPRGNSLKRVEVSTDCRVLIRGRGSIKDPTKVVYKFAF